MLVKVQVFFILKFKYKSVLIFTLLICESNEDFDVDKILFLMRFSIFFIYVKKKETNNLYSKNLIMFRRILNEIH